MNGAAMTKKCSKCRMEKPSDGFHEDKRSKTGLRSWCKTCVSASDDPEKRKAMNAAYRKNSPEKVKTAVAKWNAANRERINAKRRARPRPSPSRRRMEKYGLSPADFQLMLLAQKSVCGICEEIFSKTPHVDHCHTTGKVRGLLCGRCNVALGGFKDSSQNCRRAAEYLEIYGAN